jgi:SAM-dependent methyltransferase
MADASIRDPDLSERVKREKESYNTGLKRARYNDVLSHTDHFYQDKRFRLAGELMRARLAAPGSAGRVLELGCKTWPAYIARNGIVPDELVCINISEAELEEGRAMAGNGAVRPSFLLMDAHALQFPDRHFDIVFGSGILHHLDLDLALKEVRRVLKPDGLMIFFEPLDNNPVGRIVRKLTPRARTEDERPLRHAELARIGEAFDCTLHFEQLVTVPAGVLSRALFKSPVNPLTRGAFALDEFLRARLPTLGPYFRHVLITGRPRP